MGRRASARDWLRSAGQMCCRVTMPQATKLKTTAIPNKAAGLILWPPFP